MALGLLALAAALLAPAAARPGAAQTAPADRRAPGPDPAEVRWVEETLRSLSLRERVGQLIVTGALGEYKNFRGEKFAEVARHIEETGVGGFVFYRGDANGLAALTNEMQRRAKVPLLLAADFERGLPMQIRNGTGFTHNMGVAAAGDPAAAYREGRIIADEMRALGLNWLYGPVADVLNNPANTMVNVRSFGEDPRRVAEFVAAAVRGVRDGGVLACAKHFPGHGDTAVDSHITLPVVGHDRAHLDRVELVPFRAAIAAGVDSIMTAHMALPAVAGDNVPASLSPRLTHELLRRELKFDGIITTDSLGMGAIIETYKGAEGAVRAIKAGADVALLPPDPKAAVDALVVAVGRGELTRERVDESVRRILRAKYRAGLATRRAIDLAAVNRVVESPESVREADRTAEASITLLRNDGALLPLDAARARSAMFVVAAGDDDHEQGRVFQAQLEKRAPGARVARVDRRTTGAEYEQLLGDAGRAGLVVVAPFVKRAALKGTIALPEPEAEFIRRLVATKRPVAVVAFGSPYQLQQFPEARVYMVTYAVEDVAQAAAARALFGEVSISGRSPVSLTGLFRAGDGISVPAKSPSRGSDGKDRLPDNE